MERTLRIISIAAGLVCVVSAIILGCVYFEKVMGFVETLRHKITRTTIYGDIAE